MRSTRKINNIKLVNEKRDSRLKLTKQHILSNSLSGILNNQKWQKLFEWLDERRTVFKVTFLLSKVEMSCDWIREIEKTSILLDDSGNFVEFYEINSVKTITSAQLIKFLELNSLDFSETDREIEIYGYRK